MPKVTLSRFWNPGENRFVPGDVVDVDAETAEWLESTGALATVKLAVKSKPVKPADDDAVDEQVDPDADEPGEDDDSAARPARTAPIDTWREYAESLGIATKGLSKQELIAATR